MPADVRREYLLRTAHGLPQTSTYPQLCRGQVPADSCCPRSQAPGGHAAATPSEQWMLPRHGLFDTQLQ